MSRKHARKDTRRKLFLENLESRQLMAADILFSSGTLKVVGSDVADTISIDRETQRTLVGTRVTNTPVITARISDGTGNLVAIRSVVASQVRQIEVQAGQGDDTVRNNTTLAARLLGGDGNDTLFGGSGSDSLFGDAGDDVIHGMDGRDVLNGGDGNDTLRGGTGNDQLNGHAGNDWLYGGSGDDALDGFDGDDTILGEDGNDTVLGHNGNDSLYGGNGNDTLNGGIGNDVIQGEAGNDSLFGNEGNDKLIGSEGHDVLWGDGGNDLLVGDAGNDRLYGGAGDDQLSGGDGTDTLEGGDGNDSLLSGQGVDTLRSGAGYDRVLRREGDSDRILDQSSVDVRVNFKNGALTTFNNSIFANVRVAAGAWADSEILMIDQALGSLVRLAGNNKLLLESDGRTELKLTRYGVGTKANGDLSGLGGWNNSENGIALLQKAFTEGSAVRIVLHEIGHNWDSVEENPLFNSFVNDAGWRDLGENGAAGFIQARDSGAKNWWYADPSNGDDLKGFSRSYGQNNPKEDFADSFSAYVMSESGWDFFGESPTAIRNRMAVRFAALDAFFASL